MTNLSKKIGEMDFDGLVTDLQPAVRVRGGCIAKVSEDTIMKRGTILAKSSTTGKLFVLGAEASEGDTLTPDCILCDDTEVGASEDVSVAVYVSGCFDLFKCTVADGYTVTEADKDKLRERSIEFRAASPAV